MTIARTCPSCGADLPGDAPQGLCPRCLVQLGHDLLPAEARAVVKSPAPVAVAADPVPIANPQSQIGAASLRSFGDYELVEEIARGGMGIVYKARQRSLDRIVALKRLLFGALSSPEFVKRFRAEATVAGSLQHPNIVAIHEVGIHQGEHYLVMDFVGGQTLAKLVAQQPLPAKRAAAYLKTIAEAVHYAHERGILHRDLKPSNVLIDEFDQPRITDFGLAKRLTPDSSLATGHSSLTLTGQVLGSPNYMPPEQAASGRGKVSRRSDVYALGAMLYHLTTGRPPFVAQTPTETLQQVLEAEPVSPRLLTPSVPRDLETIALKCLEKDPARRYPTAQALADELSRFVNDEAIQARPVNAAEKLWRWCRRRPAIASLCVLVLATAAACGVLAVYASRQAIVARQSALSETHQRLRAEQALSQIQMQRAEDLFAADDAGMALAYLARVLRDNPTNCVAATRILSALTHRSFPLPVCEPLSHGAAVNSARFSVDGRWVVTASADGTAQVWDASSGQARNSPLKHDDRVNAAHFSPDGRWVVTASKDRTARVWDARTGEPLSPLLRHDDQVWFAQFSPDSQRVITCSVDKTARVWDARTGQALTPPLKHDRPVYSAEFTPDGQRIVTASLDGTARIWAAHTGGPLAQPLQNSRSARFDADGQRVVTASSDGSVRIWDARTGQPLTEPFDLGGASEWAEFSPDGQRVVTRAGATARVLDARTGQLLAELRKHTVALQVARFSPEGLRVVTASWDRTARVWDAYTGKTLGEAFRHEDMVGSAEFSPDGGRMITASGDKTARIWDVGPGQSLAVSFKHDSGLASMHFSPDGQRIVTASKDSTARVWDVRTGQALTPPLKHRNSVTTARFSPDGRRVVTASEEGTARVWDARTGQPLTEPLQHNDALIDARFSPDGALVATASGDSTARLWDAGTGQPVTEPLRHDEGKVRSIEFSPDGQWVVTASWDATARIWNVRTGQLRFKPLEPGGVVYNACFSPDGQRVATATASAQIWDARTGEPLTKPLRHDAAVDSVRFSPDGTRLVTASADRTARIWDAVTGQCLTEPMRHGDRVPYAEFSPDGQRVVTASRDGTARVWDARTGQPLSEPLRHDSRVVSARFSPDGRWVATASIDKTARIWEVTTVADPPVPRWLPDLAEAVGGQRFNAEGLSESVPLAEVLKIKRALGESSAEDVCTRLAKWFFADRATRTISPFSSVTMPEYVQRRIEENTLASLQEAARLSPTNALALARLARWLVNQDPQANPRQMGEAAFYVRRAVELAPNALDILRIRDEVAERISKLGKPSGR